MKATLRNLLLLTSAALLTPQFAFAQLTVNETFNASKTSADWYAINGACLTASTSYTTVTSGLTVPGCVTSTGAANAYYKAAGSTLISGYNGNALPDPSGYGALRLTNGSLTTGSNGNNETGLIAGTTVLPSSNGLQFTFNTVTYGGNGYNNGVSASGADGISFFLLDASYYTATTGTDANGNSVTYYPVTPGAFGGSLGYDCSSGKGGGMAGAYIGLGIDEYGNFVNSGDNGNSSDPNSPGFSPSTIGMRGAGNITTAALTTVGGFGTTGGVSSPVAAGPISTTNLTCAYGYYTYGSPTGLTTTAVTGTKNGPGGNNIISSVPNAAKTSSVVTWATNYSGSSTNFSYTQNVATYSIWTVMDYPIIVHDKLSGVTISSQEATSSTTNTSPSPSRNSSLSVPISYTLTLTHDGYMSLSYSLSGGSANQVLPPTLISNNNGPIPANFLFGFSAGTGGGSNVHEITCFKAKQIADSSSSASGNIPQNSKVQAGESLYLASYNPNNWSGSVQSFSLGVNTDGSITIASAPTWDANCMLTGTTSYIPSGSCPSGSSSSGLSPTSRAIATWNDSTLAGVTFSTANLSTAEWTQFNADGNGALRAAYLEGSRVSETSGLFRVRSSILGDIIDSSPVWVGPPQLTQLELSAWGDQLYPTATMPENSATTTYTQYLTGTAASRLNVVYVGANDGMLHGFAAGSFSGSGSSPTFVTTNNSGVEVMAYIPQLALYTIHSTVSPKLDFSAPTYSHNDFVDATPGTGDLFYGGTWHTWLVGGLGVGAQANGVVGDNTTTMTGDIYAIDVSNPKLNQSAATVASSIMGDWTSATITCNLSNVSGSCGSYMGAITGTPIIRRLHDGNWAAIFGNGLNSANGTAGIFIMEIANNTGSSGAPTITFDYIDTGVGASTTYGKNGIAYVASADMEDDHVIEYIYAGDALGNVWRFDLTGYNSTTKKLDWSNGIKNNQPFLLFQTPTNTWTDTSGTSHTGIQPITTSIAEESATYNGQLLNMIDFGTGRMYPQTLTAAEATAPGQQTIYGIWDWNMATWNSLSTTQYAASTTGPGNSPNIPTLSQLTKQTLTAYCSGGTCSGSNSATAYTEANTMVCYSGMVGSCSSSPSPSWGWYINLPATSKTSTTTNYEQIVYSPTIQSGLLFVNSTIGAAVDPLTCSVQPGTGYTYGVDAATGGGSTPTFNTAAGVPLTSGNATVISLSAVGTPIFVTAVGTNSAGQTQNVSSILYQTSSGQGGSTVINSSTATGKRVSWLELR